MFDHTEQEQMKPRERILRTLRGQVADRVPIVLPGFSYRSGDEVSKVPDPFRRKIAEREKAENRKAGFPMLVEDIAWLSKSLEGPLS